MVLTKLRERLKQVEDAVLPLNALSADEANSYVVNVQLKNHQVVGLNWLRERFHRKHGAIIGDEMGLGKTLQSISFLSYLDSLTHGKRLPSLVLAPLSVLDNWRTEIAKFAPALNVVVYTGEKEERLDLGERLVREFKAGRFAYEVVLSTYELALRDIEVFSAFQYRCLVCDEAHRLKNAASQIYMALFDLKAEFRLLLTGTPIQNNLTEIYALLRFVAPGIFKANGVDLFVDAFKNVQHESIDSEIRVLMRQILQPFLLRRVKKEVEQNLPPKTEIVLYTPLTDLQRKYYRAVLLHDLEAFQVSKTKTRLLNVLMQLRKCVNHPYLFDGVEPEPFTLGGHLVDASGKLILLDKLLPMLRDAGHRVLIFSQMTRMLDILQDYLGFRGFAYERLDGSVRGEERYAAINAFNQEEESFVFLLSTKAGGVGLNLTAADTVIFFDSDQNPQNDLQAAARAHRIGQTRPVKIIRLVAQSTVEEVILRRAAHKLKLTHTVIEGGQFSNPSASLDMDQPGPSSSSSGPSTGEFSDPSELADILRYGLSKLFSDDSRQGILDIAALEGIIGPSVGGEWVLANVKAGSLDTSLVEPQEPAILGADVSAVEEEEVQNSNKDLGVEQENGAERTDGGDEEVQPMRDSEPSPSLPKQAAGRPASPISNPKPSSSASQSLPLCDPSQQFLLNDEAEDNKTRDAGASNNIYLYMGEDYSKTKVDDESTFAALVAERVENSVSEASRPRLSRRATNPTSSSLTSPSFSSLSDPTLSKKRKLLTDEEKEAQAEEKRKKAKLAAEKKKEKEELKRQQAKMQKLQLWEDNSYTSLNLPGLDELEEPEEDLDVLQNDEDEGEDVHFVIGDVSRPSPTSGSSDVIIHVVDDSGRWGRGGVFSALSSRSLTPERAYQMAFDMEDLSLGDVHAVPLDGGNPNRLVVVDLIVAQTRDARNRVSGIHLELLDEALQRIAAQAVGLRAAVHLPRIGHSTPNFNWYAIERLLRKRFVAKKIPTYVYYFKRGHGKHGSGNMLPFSSSSTSTGPPSLDRADSYLRGQDDDVDSIDESNEGKQNKPAGSSLPVLRTSSSIEMNDANEGPPHDHDNASDALSSNNQHELPSKIGGVPPPAPEDELKDIFTDAVFWLCGFDAAVGRKLTRLVVAYNGAMAEALDATVTHVVTPDRYVISDNAELASFVQANPSIQVVEESRFKEQISSSVL